MAKATHLRHGEVVSGRYEVTTAIASGAFGQVYEARHLATGHLVALKLLRPRSGEASEALRQEFFT